jgi:hypothetical protein
MHRFAVLLTVNTAFLFGLVAVITWGVSAQESHSTDLASHPLTGTYRAMTPGGVASVIFAADGSVTIGFPPTYVDPIFGLTSRGPALGRWEATGERSGQFTAVQALSDINGTYLGTVTFEGHPTSDGTGRGFNDHEPQRVIVHDATGEVVSDEIIPLEGLSVTRIAWGAPVNQLQPDIPAPFGPKP